MRSTTPGILSAATTSRRSPAIGARSAISRTARFSVSISSASSFLSFSTIRSAPARSRWTRQRIDSRIACSASPPIWLMSARRRSRSSSNALIVCPLVGMVLLRSAVAAGDIVLGALLARVCEDFARFAIFDHLSQVEESGTLRHARGLLHIMGDDRDRITAAKAVDQFLDLRGRNRIERRARFVHQDDFGIDGDRAGNAQPLLLAARKGRAALRHPVLHLVPKAGALQRFFHNR